MSTIDVIVSLFFLVIGVWMIVFFVRLVLGAAVGDLKGFRERFKLKRKAALFREDAASFSLEKKIEYAKTLFSALHLDLGPGPFSVLDTIENHNQRVFGRLVQLTDGLDFPIKEIAFIEDLLRTRSALAKAAAEVYLSRSTIKSSAEKAGRSGPAWALDEYDKKLSELKDKLATNKSSLEKQFDSLVQTLGSEGSNEQITYH